MTTLNGEFTVTSWEESTYAEREWRRTLTRTTVNQELAGDVVRAGQVEWLMSYREDRTAHFVGLQQFEGIIDGRDGAAVLETGGDFDGKTQSDGGAGRHASSGSTGNRRARAD
jgi:hypothetical protein